jgi:hypothetical protein
MFSIRFSKRGFSDRDSFFGTFPTNNGRNVFLGVDRDCGGQRTDHDQDQAMIDVVH